MRYATVCSGLEAPSVAWESLGWTPVWFSEIDPYPSAVLKHHYPSVPNLGDMTKIIEKVGMVGHSLALVQVTNLIFTRNETGKVKVSFKYNMVDYKDISMTDPDFYNITDKAQANQAILVVSLPDAPYYGKFFKFVAKIFIIAPVV